MEGIHHHTTTLPTDTEWSPIREIRDYPQVWEAQILLLALLLSLLVQVTRLPMPQLSCLITRTYCCFASPGRCSESVGEHTFPEQSLLLSGGFRGVWNRQDWSLFCSSLGATLPFTLGASDLIAIYSWLDIHWKAVQDAAKTLVQENRIIACWSSNNFLPQRVGFRPSQFPISSPKKAVSRLSREESWNQEGSGSNMWFVPRGKTGFDSDHSSW